MIDINYPETKNALSPFSQFCDILRGHFILHRITCKETAKWEVFGKDWQTTATKLLEGTHEKYVLEKKKYS
jgi:hypothetical protein